MANEEEGINCSTTGLTQCLDAHFESHAHESILKIIRILLQDFARQASRSTHSLPLLSVPFPFPSLLSSVQLNT